MITRRSFLTMLSAVPLLRHLPAKMGVFDTADLTWKAATDDKLSVQCCGVKNQRTWIAGEVLTSAKLNNIRDNLLEIKVNSSGWFDVS